MADIDFLEGLAQPTTGGDPDTVPPTEKLTDLRRQVVSCAGRMKLFSFPEGEKPQMGPTNAADQLEGSQICEEFARAHPELAALAGEPEEHWRVYIGAKLAYLHARNTVRPLLRRARLAEAAVLKGITSDMEHVLADVDQKEQSPTRSTDDKNRLRTKFAGIREQDRLLRASAQAQRDQAGRDASRADAAAAEETQAADRLRLRAELMRRLQNGDIPALGPGASAPDPAQKGTTRKKGQTGNTGKKPKK